MDAKKFLEEWQRMCKMQQCGDDCPIYDYCQNCTPSCWKKSELSAEDFVNEIEQWIKEHSPKTRLDDLKEKYPNVFLGDKGHPHLSPRLLGYCKTNSCWDCSYRGRWTLKDCWNAEVEEE